MKKVIVYILLVLVLLTGNHFLQAEKSTGFQTHYETLQGSIYEEGTGTMNMLFFKTDKGKKYLIKGGLQKTLKNLKGIPLLLTGKVKEKKKEFFHGEIKVELYNTLYDEYIFSLQKKSLKEVPILGILRKENDDLVVLTPDQQVIRLASKDYSSLQQYVGEKILIIGDLFKLNDYEAKMKIKSYRAIN